MSLYISFYIGPYASVTIDEKSWKDFAWGLPDSLSHTFHMRAPTTTEMDSIAVIPNQEILSRETMVYADSQEYPPKSFSSSQIEEEMRIFQETLGEAVKGLPGVLRYELRWGLVQVIS